MSVPCPRILPAGFIEPCIPTAARVPPTGPGWLHEIKHDGYRLVARLEGRRVRLFTRRGHEWSDRFPRIREALASLKATSATIDGEAVVLCPKTGLSVFDELHSGRRDRDAILYAFDLIELNGDDLRREPLEVHKATLTSLLTKTRAGIRINEHIEEDGATVFRHACKLGCEGIVSKQRDSICRAAEDARMHMRLIATGSSVGYDRLLLATASLAFCFFAAWFWTSPSSA
jgi:bifunctional non-homologous end joining protein LigD